MRWFARFAVVAVVVLAGVLWQSGWFADRVPEVARLAKDAVGDVADRVDQDAAAPGSPDSSQPAPDYIAAVTATADAEGEVYWVRPTRAGRLAPPDQLDVAWRQAVARGVPDQAGLRQQFLCHPLSVVARSKQTWDLEPWRPVVGLARTMLAGCNPG